MKKLFDMLGADYRSPSFVSAMEQLGFDTEIEWEMHEDEGSGYLERPDLGFALAVADKSILGTADGPELPLGLNGWVFSNLFLYLDRVDEYEVFAGDLPLGLTLPLSRQSLTDRFGESELQRRTDARDLRFERWAVDGQRQLHVTYARNDAIAVLSLGLRRVGS
jgi:hypothetical protein